MTRRLLLRYLGAAGAASLPAVTGLQGVFAVRKGSPASGGYGTVKTWRWVGLPGSGLQVCVTAPSGSTAARVEWTTGGAVTVLDMVATAGPTTVTVIRPGWSLSVRRIGS